MHITTSPSLLPPVQSKQQNISTPTPLSHMIVLQHGKHSAMVSIIGITNFLYIAQWVCISLSIEAEQVVITGQYRPTQWAKGALAVIIDSTARISSDTGRRSHRSYDDSGSASYKHKYL